MQTIEINGPKGVDSRWTSVPGVAGRNIGGDTKREKRRREKKVGVEYSGSIYNKAGVISTG